jgi:hypothetical protein
MLSAGAGGGLFFRLTKIHTIFPSVYRLHGYENGIRLFRAAEPYRADHIFLMNRVLKEK